MTGEANRVLVAVSSVFGVYTVRLIPNRMSNFDKTKETISCTHDEEKKPTENMMGSPEKLDRLTNE